MTALTVALTPAGMSPLRCVCGVQLSHKNVEAMKSFLLECSCGHSMFNAFCCEVSINPDCAHLLDDEAVFATTWYHLTYREDWQGETLGDRSGRSVMVHLGTLDGAIEREAESYGADRDFPLYIYELRITPGAPLSAQMLKDDDCWPEFAWECEEHGYETGVHRYANAVEAAGSISLLADARYVQVLTRHEV